MLVDKLSDYATATRTERLPDDVVHAAKRCVIDWFAAAIPGGVIPPATLLLEALEDDIGHGDATLFPS
ncbi:MAG: MmgE/PrpD family protein, partial [Acidiferrobacterales bacterium]